MNFPSLRVPARRGDAELIDEPSLHIGELGGSLADVRGVNRLLGGTAAALAFLGDRSELRPGASATLLDVGTGSADIPLAMAGWAKRRGVDLRVTATDLNPEMLDVARSHVRGRGNLDLRVADALALPFADRSYDYVMCNMMLHHLDPPDALRTLRELWRVASRAILVSDIRRGRPGYWGARLWFALTTRNPLTTHDGPLSVLRAYTVEELRALGVQAGLERVLVRPRPVNRLELRAEREGVLDTEERVTDGGIRSSASSKRAGGRAGPNPKGTPPRRGVELSTRSTGIARRGSVS